MSPGISPDPEPKCMHKSIVMLGRIDLYQNSPNRVDHSVRFHPRCIYVMQLNSLEEQARSKLYEFQIDSGLKVDTLVHSVHKVNVIRGPSLRAQERIKVEQDVINLMWELSKRNRRGRSFQRD
jgi:hypothetical protein